MTEVKQCSQRIYDSRMSWPCGREVTENGMCKLHTETDRAEGFFGDRADALAVKSELSSQQNHCKVAEVGSSTPTSQEEPE